LTVDKCSFKLTDMTAKRPPKKQRERKVWIKAHLELAGSSFSDIARELKIRRQSVQQVLNKSSRRVELAIAAKLGFTPEEIWPERYPAAAGNNTNGRVI
jgi:Ner family transcriptional regulator